MSTSINDVMRSHGFSPLSEFSGLPKNVRKRRNSKIRHAALHGGSGGISALLGSVEYTTYTDPKRFNKGPQIQNSSTRLSSLPGFSAPTGLCGGWGRLPNVSPIDYADDDPRGWVTVTRNKRNRACRIQDDEEDYYEDN